jgi:predicted nucleic acid-binding protein
VAWAILDTGVYIANWEGRLGDLTLETIRSASVVRHSAVVLSELRRGARTRDAIGLADALYRLAKVQWAPLAVDWWEAGQIIRAIGDAQRWDVSRRRSFQNDVLIALTARRHGATVVTTNRRDVELIAQQVGVRILPV